MTEATIRNGVIYGRSAEVVAKVCKTIPHMSNVDPAHAVGLGLSVRGKMVGGAVFYNQRGDVDIEVAISAASPRWCRPAVLRQLFAYPFHQLGLTRISAITASDNVKVRRLMGETLGWKLEGIIRKGLDGKQDALVWGILRDECRWL